MTSALPHAAVNTLAFRCAEIVASTGRPLERTQRPTRQARGRRSIFALITTWFTATHANRGESAQSAPTHGGTPTTTWTSTHRLPVKTNRQAVFGLRERSAHTCGDSTEIQSVQVDSPNRLSPRILKNSYLCETFWKRTVKKRLAADDPAGSGERD
jgi:hypothetical protein